MSNVTNLARVARNYCDAPAASRVLERSPSPPPLPITGSAPPLWNAHDCANLGRAFPFWAGVVRPGEGPLRPAGKHSVQLRNYLRLAVTDLASIPQFRPSYGTAYTLGWHVGVWHAFSPTFLSEQIHAACTFALLAHPTRRGTYDDTVHYADGKVRYRGEWRHGRFHGEGTLYWQLGKIQYLGSWCDGLRHGHGIDYCLSGARYEGMWENGARHGNGTQYRADGTISFEGSWKDDMFDGHGAEYDACGMLLYNGQWQAGEPRGVGTLYGDGWTYTGDVANRQRAGHGVCRYHDGAIFHGLWANDMRHGLGKLTLLDGSDYVGDWVENKKHGLGTYIFPRNHPRCGWKYQGAFSQGQMHGMGTLGRVDRPATVRCRWELGVEVPYQVAAPIPAHIPVSAPAPTRAAAPPPARVRAPDSRKRAATVSASDDGLEKPLPFKRIRRTLVDPSC